MTIPKRLTSVFIFACLAVSMCLAVSAETKPAVEVMDFTAGINSVGSVSVSIYFRNNSGKTIKYIDWDLTAYNRVDDKLPSIITGNSSISLQTVGPCYPFSVVRISGSKYEASASRGTPFEQTGQSGYYINNHGSRSFVLLDKYDNFYTTPSLFSSDDQYVYLTDDEVNNAMYFDYTDFNTIYYNSVFDHFNLDSVTVTYMDGSQQTINGADAISNRRYATLQNPPFLPMVESYSAVYDYNTYKSLNPDLANVFGENEKLLFEHFISSGMQEGRQGSLEFNLDAYKANNPDLVAAFGSDNAKYYEHYISSGRAEGRIAA